MNIDNLPESPASITLSVKSPNGYDVLFTLRNTNLDAMITDLLESEARLLKLGYLPKGGATQTAIKKTDFDSSVPCDQCQSPTKVIEGVAKSTGRPYKMRVCDKSKNPNCKWKSFL